MRTAGSARQRERGFGLTVGTACGVLAALSRWHGRTLVSAVAATAGAALVVLALLAPASLRTLNAGWTRLAHGMAWINTRIVLSVVFLLILTPLGLLLRLGGWDPLRRRRGSSSPGWVPSSPRRRDTRHYEKLY